MNNVSNKAWMFPALIILLLAGGAYAAYHFYGARSSTSTAAVSSTLGSPSAGGDQSAASPDHMKQIFAGIAYLDLHGSDLPPGKTAVDVARSFNSDPDRILQDSDKRITLVPYEGSLTDPSHLVDGGLANSLDRAQLHQFLLRSAGLDARIVSILQDGNSVFARYAATTPGTGAPVKPETLSLLNNAVHELTPSILAKLKSGPGVGTWAAGLTPAKIEKRLYWVQYNRSGQWVDFIPADSTIPVSKRSGAQVLSPDTLATLTWQFKLTVTNSYSGNSVQTEVLSFAAPALDLNGVALSFTNQPDDTRKQFIPSLFFGDKKIAGTSFALKQGDRDLDQELLKFEITGPSDSRHFERLLVGPKGDASDSERLLEVAALARITVVSSSFSDLQFKRAIAPNMIQAARILFGKLDQAQDAPPNFVSADALAVLDATHHTAGRIGDASSHVLAFQARPSLAVERDFIQLNGDSLQLVHSFDIVDPGHSLYAPSNTPRDTLIQAAVEQSVIDSWIEDRVASGKSVKTSLRAVRDLVASQAPLDITKLPANIGNDKFGSSAQPAYRLGSAGAGKAAGWRFDPGPQIVPLLGNFTGGTESAGDPMSRVRQLCKAIPTDLVLIPTEMFPQKFLLGGLVKYDCALAEAYVAAANKIGAIGDLISGNPKPNSNMSDEDFKKLIDALGPDLVKNIVLGALGQSASGLTVRAALGEGGDEHSLTDKLLEYAAAVIAESGADKAAEKIKDYLDEMQKERQGGESGEQIEGDAAKNFSLH